MSAPDSGPLVAGPAEVAAPVASRGTPAPGDAAALPAYLREVYSWAYLNPRNARLLDREAVVSAILFGNNTRLQRALLAEIAAGDWVLQAAHVYGRLIPQIADRVGAAGRLEVIDLVPLQAARCRAKLRGFSQACVRIADAADPGAGDYDVVSSFFLLHEIPDAHKRAVVDALLARTAPGGKVVFVDYHGPAAWNPLRGVMRQLLRRLEPFAESLWQQEIRDFASLPDSHHWCKETFFGGLYQKTVATRR